MSNPPPQESLEQAHKRARWSLICGILSVVGFGLVAGVPACILGYRADTAIRRSGGTMRGLKMATLGILLGAVGSALPFILFVVSEKEGEIDEYRRAQATSVEKQILEALMFYQDEFDRIPRNLGDQREVTLGADNNRLFDVLRAKSGTEKENPTKSVFSHIREEGDIRGTWVRGGFRPDGVLYDPWGRPYQVRINLSGVRAVSNPYKRNAGPETLPFSAIVWSLGKDGQLGRKGDGDANADVVSWRLE